MRPGRLLFFALLLSLTAPAFAAQHPVALFYLTSDPNGIRDFFAHSSQIDLLVPTWYQVDENGLVTGAPEPAVLAEAQKEKLPVMPIVALFNKTKFHMLATSTTAQDTMNEALVRECKLHGYTGFQFDLENVEWTDRDALTALVTRTAEVLHKAGLQLSIATVPNAPGYPGSGGFAKWIYTDWRGAYDLAGLAKAVDLVCLMTYDQNTRWTTPGPVAGWQWTVDNLKYALQFVPKEKLSLGIPLYGYHWYTGTPTITPPTQPGGEATEKPNPTADYISAEDALQLAHDWNGKIEWDDVDHGAWFYFYRDQMREWVFYTDLRTFRDRYELMQQDGLEGFCSWVLGTEDPAIWTILPKRQ
ncbi:MAG TPA: glycosyl hydrolase family 18 protein [Acidobacteriaceae bacterium]|jgi:spore germination protein YaaH|nr:glycosyl hydrolase family 18 protein [Acidobacteriaceae bacterium]